MLKTVSIMGLPSSGTVGSLVQGGMINHSRLDSDSSMDWLLVEIPLSRFQCEERQECLLSNLGPLSSPSLLSLVSMTLG